MLSPVINIIHDTFTHSKSTSIVTRKYFSFFNSRSSLSPSIISIIVLRYLPLYFSRPLFSPDPLFHSRPAFSLPTRLFTPDPLFHSRPAFSLPTRISHHPPGHKSRRIVCRQEGARGFYKGLGPYLLHVTPNICMVFIIYERLAEWLVTSSASATSSSDRRTLREIAESPGANVESMPDD